MEELVKKIVGDDKSHTLMMLAAWTGVCVLVGVGKLKPETIELLLFAILGAASKQTRKHSDEGSSK